MSHFYPHKQKAIYFDDDAIEEGYRGFADFSYTLGVGDGQDIDRVSVLTSHGYQIAPQFYAGAGFGVNYFYDLRVCKYAYLSPLAKRFFE